MALRIGINGFGRIGRLVVRAALDRGAGLEWVAVNDITDIPTLAHLLRYDSVHGIAREEISTASNGLLVNGRLIRVLAEKDPEKLPWRDMGVDVVVESTG